MTILPLLATPVTTRSEATKQYGEKEYEKVDFCELIKWLGRLDCFATLAMTGMPNLFMGELARNDGRETTLRYNDFAFIGYPVNVQGAKRQFGEKKLRKSWFLRTYRIAWSSGLLRYARNDGKPKHFMGELARNDGREATPLNNTPPPRSGGGVLFFPLLKQRP